MQKTKSVKIDNQSIIVKELSVKDIMNLFNVEKGEDKNNTLTEQMNSIIPKVVDISLDDLKMMYPSEIEIIWDTVKEVNKSFLDIMISLGLKEGIETIMKSIGLNMQLEFSKNFKDKSVI